METAQKSTRGTGLDKLLENCIFLPSSINFHGDFVLDSIMTFFQFCVISLLCSNDKMWKIPDKVHWSCHSRFGCCVTHGMLSGTICHNEGVIDCDYIIMLDKYTINVHVHILSLLWWICTVLSNWHKSNPY